MQLRLLGWLLIFVLLMMGAHVRAQGTYTPEAAGPYTVATLDTTFDDGLNSTGALPLRMFYPTTSGGTIPENCPTIAFGHGFVMNYLDYVNLFTHFASHGYVVVTLDVQNGTSTNHTTYSQQLGGALHALVAEGQRSGSRLFGKMSGKTASMGHSMGGGGTMLVPTLGGMTPTAVVGLAPAQTTSTPTATEAMTTTQVPSLFLVGALDRVTPTAQHGGLMYDNSASSCKLLVSFIGGGHCGFADRSTICDVGANLSGERPVLNYAQQQGLTLRYATAFLDYFLRDQDDALPYLCGTFAATDSEVTYQTTIACTGCVATTSRAASQPFGHLGIAPNPSTGHTQLRLGDARMGAGILEVYGLDGRQVWQDKWPEGSTEYTLQTAQWPTGAYQVILRQAGQPQLSQRLWVVGQ
jgi:dienelactone hydrolase